VSALAADDAAHPWIVTLGIIVLGLAIAALGPAVAAVLPRRRAATVAAAAFVLSGVVILLVAAFPIDCSLDDATCHARFEAGRLSTATDVHLWLGLVYDVVFVVTPFAIARALWPRPEAALSLGAGLVGIAIGLALFPGENVDALGGLFQRIGLLLTHVWVVLVAAAVLQVVARECATPAFVPVRPRDFFGRAWEGDGQLVAQPVFLWRRLPRRLHFRREIRWLSDDAWIVEDTNTFASGYVLARRMVCSTDGDGRIQVTAGDMPDGAVLELAEGGYRVKPYRYAFAVGPLRFTFTCHDRVEELPDGSLDWTIDYRWHGLPASRLSGRVRPVAS
jgi:MFS family permease